MTTWSAPLPGEEMRYSRRPCWANRRTIRSISLSVFRPPDENAANGRPARSFCARSTTRAWNAPRSTEWWPTRANSLPPGCVSSVTWPLSLAEIADRGAPLRFFMSRSCRARASVNGISGVWTKQIELAFRQRPVQPSKRDRDIVEAPRCEATIEMPHPWNDHPGDRNVDVGTGLIEDEKIEACSLGGLHAGRHLFARIETAEFRAGLVLGRRLAVRSQIGMVL